jgi:hypothetical protein
LAPRLTRANSVQTVVKTVRPKWALTSPQAAALLKKPPPMERAMVGLAALKSCGMPPPLGLNVSGAAPQPGARLRVSAFLMARLDYRDDDPKDKDRYYDEMDAVTRRRPCHRSRCE